MVAAIFPRARRRYKIVSADTSVSRRRRESVYRRDNRPPLTGRFVGRFDERVGLQIVIAGRFRVFAGAPGADDRLFRPQYALLHRMPGLRRPTQQGRAEILRTGLTSGRNA